MYNARERERAYSLIFALSSLVALLLLNVFEWPIVKFLLTIAW